MLVTLAEVLVTCHGNVQRGTGPQPHAIGVVGVGITCLHVQAAYVAHHHVNDPAVRGVPSGHYSVYGDTHPPRSARSDPRLDQRTQTGSDVATEGVRGDRGYSVQLPLMFATFQIATIFDTRGRDSVADPSHTVLTVLLNGDYI